MAYRDDSEAYRRHREILAQIRIASPCSERWEDMSGDDRARRCNACDKDVYDLSAMRADEAVRLISEREGRKCLRMFRRHDGTVLTADCPVGARQRRIRRAVVASTVGVMSTAFGTALEPAEAGIRQPTPLVRAVSDHPKAHPRLGLDFEQILGFYAPPSD